MIAEVRDACRRLRRTNLDALVGETALPRAEVESALAFLMSAGYLEEVRPRVVTACSKPTSACRGCPIVGSCAVRSTPPAARDGAMRLYRYLRAE